MFSYLSRGYGTWEGIAKLEKPDSAISPANRGTYDILPPIRSDPYRFYDQHFDHEGLYHIPQENFKLPEVPKNSLHIPKTYSTKRGALLLYSEKCSVPGSRRLKKRPRFKRQKEERLQTLKDLMELIMDYKKNGCDPLLLEQLWRRMSRSARDVQPGYSPKQYLSHLSHTTFDPDSWKKLVETGSLKSFGTTDDGFLPSLLADKYGNSLKHTPAAYKTMSLPPVSPSNSMVGSFTFYKHALSTGAASMVSLPSVNSETIDDQLSARTAGTFVESLAERLAEVESEAGFKKDYETLSAKEKEELLTQLLMDVTLHNQGDVITVPSQPIAESSTVNTDESYLSGTKQSESHESLKSYHSTKDIPTKSTTSNKSTGSLPSEKSSRSDRRPKSVGSSKSSKSVSSRNKSVCSLPPIVSKDTVDLEKRSKSDSLSSSRSGLSLVHDNFEVGLNEIDIEIDNDSYYFDTDIGLERKDSETRSLGNEKTSSTQSLIDALSIQDGQSIHQFTDETKSLKSLGSSHGVVRKSASIDENLGDSGVGGGSKISDSGLANGMVHGDSIVGDDVGDGIHAGDHGVTCDGGVDDGGIGSDGDVGVDGGSGDGTYGDGKTYSDGPNISIISVTKDPYIDGNPDYHNESSQHTMPTIDVVPATAPQAPHMSLSSLQDEVRLVATEVLSRPKSGRILAADAEMATFLLLERMQGLLDPRLTAENVRASSAAPKKVRPLGQPRNSKVKEKKRVRSAEATLASRSLFDSEEKQAQHAFEPDEKRVDQVSVSEEKQVDQISKPEDKQVDQGSVLEEKQVDQVSKPEEKQADQVSKPEEKQVNQVPKPKEKQVNQVSMPDEKQVDQVSKPKEKQVDQVSKPEEKQVDQVSSEVQKPQGEVDTLSKTAENEVSVTMETQTQSPQNAPEGESLLTVKDLQPDKKQENETKTDVVKETKENVHKGAKVKKGGNTKRVVNKVKKKKSLVRKAPPFHAGLVPETKPPKGLAQKKGEIRKKGHGKQTSPDLQEKTELKTTEPLTNSNHLPPEIPVRVDSETGEVEHRISPARSEKSLSRNRNKTPSAEKISVPHEGEVSVRAETVSPRAESTSSRGESDSPREKTPSPRDKTPSPREERACPRDKDAVFRENVNTNLEKVTETEAPTREPSPEIVLTEKQRRTNARAAQRAAAAERRRQEVERKRREREEARRRAQDEEARLEVLRQEAEEEMKKREEERRIQKEQEERERMRIEAEQNERARQERLVIERQRQAREEWKRRKEQLVAQRKFEEELRQERERVEQQIEDERRREYEEKIAHLEETERERLMEERRLEEERIKREIQEEKERREAERLKMLEERRQMEEELAAARERQLARRTFLETLLKDFQNLLLDQRITRAFTFSYFDILPWFKDRWRDLEEDRPLSKRVSTQLDTVPEESENEVLEQVV